jgi:hypothetical protein
MDADSVERLLIRCSSEGRTLTYTEALAAFGMRFTRPKMRSLCKILGEVNDRAAARGEPELAVLVVRSSDGLPGDGWWAGRDRYLGDWTGTQAERYVRARQNKAYRFWKNRGLASEE